MTRDEKVVSLYIFTTNPKAMKTIFTLVLSLTFIIGGFCCSFSPLSFCEMTQYEGNMIYGRVVQHTSNGVRLEVLDVLKGAEVRDTITVWNGKDFLCMDTVIIEANVLGQVGDTVFAILPLIDSIENNWEILGDYRMPNYITSTYLLNVQNDTIRGFIKGYNYAPLEYRVMQYSLNGFLQAWNTNSNCADIQVSVEEPTAFELIAIYPNPTTDNLTIKNLPPDANLELHNLSGQLINTFEIGTTQLSTAHLAAGTYLLKINYLGESGFRKIVKL